MKKLHFYFVFIVFFLIIFSRYAYSYNSIQCLEKYSGSPNINKLIKSLQLRGYDKNNHYDYIENYANGLFIMSASQKNAAGFIIAGNVFACNGDYPNAIASLIRSFTLHISNNHNNRYIIPKFDKYIGINATSVNWIFLIFMLLLLIILLVFLRIDKKIKKILLIITAISITIKSLIIFFLQFHENIFKHLNDVLTYEAFSQYIYKNFHTGKSLLLSFYNFSWPAPAYSFYNGLIYILFGNNIITVEIINSIFIGTLSSLLVYFLAKKIFDEKVGIISFALFSFSPDLLFFNSTGLKISVNIFIVLLVFYIIFSWNNKFKYLKFLTLLLFIYYDGLLRVYSGIFIAISLILWLIIERRKYNFKLFEIVVAILLLIFVSFKILNYDLFHSINLFAKSHKNKNYITAASKYISNGFSGGKYIITVPKPIQRAVTAVPKPIQRAVTAVLDIIIKTIYYIFSPFLWLLPLKYVIMLPPSIIYWYLLLPFFVYGSIKWLRVDLKNSSIFLIYILTVSGTIIFFTNNMMQMYIYRVQLLPLLYIVASYGISKIKIFDSRSGY